LLVDAAQAIRQRDEKGLRALCGAAPVTRQSGRSKTVGMRYACRNRLRQAVHPWGLGAVRYDPRAADHYRRLRARGKNHNRATRGVVDRLISMLIAMLRDGTLYDPGKRIPATG
jgi:transposase